MCHGAIYWLTWYFVTLFECPLCNIVAWNGTTRAIGGSALLSSCPSSIWGAGRPHSLARARAALLMAMTIWLLAQNSLRQICSWTIVYIQSLQDHSWFSQWAKSYLLATLFSFHHQASLLASALLLPIYKQPTISSKENLLPLPGHWKRYRTRFFSIATHPTTLWHSQKRLC